MPDLALHPCTPYRARLTLAGCIARWQRAQGLIERGKRGGGSRRGNATQVNAERVCRVLHCRECRVGAARAAG